MIRADASMEFYGTRPRGGAPAARRKRPLSFSFRTVCRDHGGGASRFSFTALGCAPSADGPVRLDMALAKVKRLLSVTR